MTVEMHMIGIMYGLTDEFTVMAMVPYIINSMEHLTRMGVRFTTESDGVGDVTLSGIYALLKVTSPTPFPFSCWAYYAPVPLSRRRTLKKIFSILIWTS